MDNDKPDTRFAADRPAGNGPVILVVMGVSGSGKSAIAAPLAHRLGWAFEEGDDLHPPHNIAKMASGHPLDDADRRPWLDAIGAWIDARLAEGRSGIVTCSALKRIYRTRLRQDRPEVRFLFLRADEAVLARRIEHRQGHFMPSSLLHSQFETLEEPGADEPVLVVDVADRSVGAIVADLARRFAGSGSNRSGTAGPTS